MPHPFKIVESVCTIYRSDYVKRYFAEFALSARNETPSTGFEISASCGKAKMSVGRYLHALELPAHKDVVSIERSNALISCP
jgi:hypothetical protein